MALNALDEPAPVTVQEGELFGVANLLSARQTSMLRDRERESKLKYEIKLMEIENKTTGAGGGGAAAADQGAECGA